MGTKNDLLSRGGNVVTPGKLGPVIVAVRNFGWYLRAYNLSSCGPSVDDLKLARICSINPRNCSISGSKIETDNYSVAAFDHRWTK